MNTIMRGFLGCLLFGVGFAGDAELPVAAQSSTGEQSVEQGASPRETVAEYLYHIGRGEGRAAFGLTAGGSGVSWGNDFPKLKDFHQIRPLHQLGTKAHALIVSNRFRSRGRTEIFYACLTMSQGQWHITRSGRAEPEEAVWMMKGYQANPDVEVDALPEELVGRWWAVCDSTIVMSADGSGTELRVGPGGPEPGAEPEAFKWELRGGQLMRRFDDREESLKIVWLDDESVSFRQPNDSGWGRWERRD